MVEMGGLLSLECKGGETHPHCCSCFFHNTAFLSRNIIHHAPKSFRLECFMQKMHSDGQRTPRALNQAPSLPASQPTSHGAVGHMWVQSWAEWCRVSPRLRHAARAISESACQVLSQCVSQGREAGRGTSPLYWTFTQRSLTSIQRNTS